MVNLIEREKIYIILPDSPIEEYKNTLIKLLKNGAKLFQFRRKKIEDPEFKNEAKEIKNIIKEFQGLLVINDRVKIAKEININAIHIGKDDIPIKEARKILGSSAIIGYTVNTLEDALYAKNNNASYIGLGPFFYTKTKEKLKPYVTKETVENIKNILNIPIFAIGGINLENIQKIKDWGLKKVAISSGIFKSGNPVYTFLKIKEELEN